MTPTPTTRLASFASGTFSASPAMSFWNARRGTISGFGSVA